MLSTGAFNALLKTLEEPYEHIIFVLATTDIHKIPLTILSRCQRFDFTNINEDEISNLLRKISDEEKIKVNNDVLDEIANMSDGSVRDALSILDKLSKLSTNITMKELEENTNTISTNKINDFIEAIYYGDTNIFNKFIFEIKNNNYDINRLIRQIIKIIVNNHNSERLFDKKYKQIVKLINQNYYSIINSFDKYVAFQMTLSEIFDGKIEISNETKEELLTDQEKLTEETTNNDNYCNLKEIFDIRLNNCFVNANKEELTKARTYWKKILEDLEQSDLPLYSILADGKIVLSSENIMVASYINNSSIDLIISKYDKIKNYISKSISFVSDDIWNVEKNKYVNKLKNNEKYEIISEPELIIQKKCCPVEKTAKELFGEENVEIN